LALTKMFNDIDYSILFATL